MANVNSSRIITDTFKALETIPSFAAVSLSENGQIQNTNWPDITSVSNFLGISLNAGFGGQDIEVCLFGVIENPSWLFIPLKPIYLYYTGTITQNNPEKAMRKIGKAISVNKLFLFPSELILLN